MTIAVSDLADQAQREFGHLSELGYTRAERELIAENSYRGGFILKFSREDSACQIEYADYELCVSIKGVCVFDAKSHPGFSGNTFSREHLADCLPKIAAEIRAVVVQGTHRVA
jgi:hypothetical protein